jgi:hypothetical protein
VINVLVAEMPRVEMDLVRGFIARVPDIASHALADYPSLDEAVRQTRPDVILVDIGAGPLPRRYLDALRQYAGLKVLTIEAEGRHGALVEMRPQRVALEELSPARLIDAIRAAAKTGSPA